jgi:hypothetical protein
MRSCVFTVLILVVVTAAVGLLLYTMADRFEAGTPLSRAARLLRPVPPEIPARRPVDYLVLQQMGGIPQAEAERAGIATDSYAYLRTFAPLQTSQGITEVTGILLGGKSYDFCYQFNTAPPEKQYLEFNLEGKWDELHFGFGFDDTHASDPEQKWSIELTIQGDGAELMAPQLLSPVGKPYFGKVAVKGVSRVTFTSRRLGYINPFAPVLVDPFVIRAATGKEAVTK